MASSFITNALQINFYYVLGIQDNEGTVNMFKALEAFGLRGFLGCPSVLYEQELAHFFDTAIVQDGDITCAVSGKYVTISESRFTSVFNLPTDGLTDLSEVPNHLVMQARTVFAKFDKPVPYSCKKRLLKYEFRLLNDILAKSITVKAGSFDAVTHERFFMMTAIHFGVKINWSKILFEVLKEMADRTVKRAKGFAAQICVILKGDPAVTLGEAKTFPHLKILSENTVNTYVSTNKTIDTRGKTDEPEVAKVTIVKRKSVSKKKSALTDKKGADEEPVEVVEKTVSKKRSASTGYEPAITKKRRTTKTKVFLSKASLELVSVAQDVEPISVVPAVEEIIEKEQEASTTDDVDQIIARIITENAEMETEEMFVEIDAGISDVTAEATGTDVVMGKADFVEPPVAGGIATGTDLAEQVEPRSDDITVEVAERSNSVTDEEDLEPFSKVLETSVSPISDDESLTIEEHLAQIPEGMMLPSLTSAEPTKIKFCSEIEIRGVEDGDWYRENLPKIAAIDKGMKSQEEPDIVQWHPAREQFKLICGDIDFLILLREQVITEMTSFFHSFSLRNFKAMRSVKDIISKEEKMLAWAETDSLETAIQRRLLIIAKYREVLLCKFLEARRTNLVSGLPTTAIDQRTLDILSAAHQQAVRNLLSQMRAHGLKWTRPVNSMLFEEPNLERGFFIPRTHKTIFSTCWLENLRKIEGHGPVQGMDSQRPLVKTWGLVPVGSVFGDSSIPRRIVDNASYRIQILDSVLPDFSVQISPVVDITSAPTDSALRSPRNSDISLPSPNQSSSSASSMHFTDDILQGVTFGLGIEILGVNEGDWYKASLPQIAISDKGKAPLVEKDDIKGHPAREIFNLICAYIDFLVKLREKKRDDAEKLKDVLLLHIRGLEQRFTEILEQQDRTYQGLFAHVRQEVQLQKAALSLEVLESRRKLQSQQVAWSQDMDNKLKGVQDHQDALSHDLMEFRVQAQENFNTLTSQLSELVDYINRGGHAKNGESGSSRGPQPPPDDRGRPGSGNGGSRPGGGSRSESSSKRYYRSGGSHKGSGRGIGYWLGEK
ncbi:hypothetical protein F511_27189 [Dorcoceras hygrometricum]|uniref:Dystroglycan-like n=1 Tax=Dorcoceras hygrometricum TaxID=472368 RepID=A0A2Z7CLK7_9LAMI|nr:hypothetical protein F511_27189 [Dorcoceras hygrometricum]